VQREGRADQQRPAGPHAGRRPDGGRRRWPDGGRRCRGRLRAGMKVPDRDALGRGAAPGHRQAKVPAVRRHPRRTRPAGLAELAEDVLDLRGHGPAAGMQPSRDFLIAEAAGHEGKDVQLPRRQASGQLHRCDGDEDGLPMRIRRRPVQVNAHPPSRGVLPEEADLEGRGLGVGQGVVNQRGGGPEERGCARRLEFLHGAVWVDEGRERVSRGRYSAPALPGGLPTARVLPGQRPSSAWRISSNPPDLETRHRMDLR
jgi:hypothetical protein